MARKARTMDDTEIAALVRQEIDDAKEYDASDEGSEKSRKTALEYYRGVMSDTKAQKGRSSAVSMDLAEVVDYVVPALVRTFLASDKPIIYEPTKPGDEEFAKQSTEYVNYVLLRECNFYRVLHDAIKDACLLRNGIIKHWWDKTPEVKTESYYDLSDQAYLATVEQEDVEVIGHTERPGPLVPNEQDPEGPPVQSVLHDLKVSRTINTGRLRMGALPPEDFLIDRDARDLEDAYFCAHRSEVTRSELLERGYARDLVDQLGGEDHADDHGEEQARNPSGRGRMSRNGTSDRSMEKIDLYECYIKVDADGDGIAEWRRVDIAGGGGTRDSVLLRNDEWEGELPFTDFVIERVPHRWAGRSIFDQMQEIQRIRTVLQRQMLDNLYAHNNPQREVVAERVKNLDEVVSPQFNGIMLVDEIGATREINIPFVGGETLAIMEYLDAVIEKRTGVSRQTQAMDPDALQNQTATAVMAAQSQSYVKTEMYARNLAEMGMARLAKCILKLIVQHQDRPRVIRLRDTFVEMDPRRWDAGMDVAINVGLGTGSRERDASALQMILGQMEKILTTAGQNNGIVSLKQYRDANAKLVETVNIKNPEQFFSEVTPETEQALAEQQASQQGQDPAVMKAQAEIEASQVKAQAEMELKQAEAQMKAQIEAEKGIRDLQIARERLASEMTLKREEMQMQLQLQRERDALEHERKLQEMQAEFELRKFALAHSAAQGMAGGATNIPRAM